MKTRLKALFLTTIIASTAAKAGFYGGVGVGVRPLASEFTDLSIMGVKIDNLTEAVTKPAVNFVGGYQYTFKNNFYLASELFYDYMDMSASRSIAVPLQDQTLADETLSASAAYNAGLGFLFGYKTANTDVFYTRLGFLLDEIYYHAVQTVLHVTTDNEAGQHYAGAVQLGLGFVHPFTQHWSMRAEYTYSRYPEENISFDVTTPYKSTISFTPVISINAVTVSAVYAFN